MTNLGMEENGQWIMNLKMPNDLTSTSVMTTGKSFDIDYSKVWNRHEYEFQILVGGNFFEILKNRKCWRDCFVY